MVDIRRKPKLTFGLIAFSILSTLIYLSSPAIWLRNANSHTTENGPRVCRYPAWRLAQNPMSSKIEPITVVTAYWNIGAIYNGIPFQSKDPKRYMRYMESYAYIENPVVAYFDDPVMEELFQVIRNRSGLPTKTVLFRNRTKLWAFNLEPRIKEIYSHPDYPKVIPNFHSSYDCATHAKFVAVPHAIQANYFNTEYFAWCDMGYFRDMPAGLKSHYHFRITLPPKFDMEKVAFTEISAPDDKLSLKDIFFKLRFWVASGLFIGRAELLSRLAEDYQYSTEKFLRMNLSETDQQILYGMYSRFNLDIPRTEIQVYLPDGTTRDPWMFLGELLREIWWQNNPIPNECHNCNRSQLIDFF